MDLKPAHARGLNVPYADTHLIFSPFANRPTNFAMKAPGGTWRCLEDSWAVPNWQGYFE